MISYALCRNGSFHNCRTRIEDKIVIHCKGGLGRAATIASMILGLYGEAAKDSINKIRKRGVQVVLTLHKRDFFLKMQG